MRLREWWLFVKPPRKCFLLLLTRRTLCCPVVVLSFAARTLLRRRFDRRRRHNYNATFPYTASESAFHSWGQRTTNAEFAKGPEPRDLPYNWARISTSSMIRPCGCAKKLGGSKEPFRDIAQADATAALVVMPTMVLRQAVAIACSVLSSWRRPRPVADGKSELS